jgi:hypothetical protein
MTDCLLTEKIAEEIKDFVVQAFLTDSTYGNKEWKTLNPIELGILSWLLGNFDCWPLW